MSNSSNLRPPSYRRHKPTGQAVVTLNGRDRYLGEYGKAASKQAYQRLVAEWLVNGGTLPDQRDDVTVVEVIAAYLKFCRSYYRKNGKLTNEVTTLKRALIVVKELYGREHAAKFGPLALKACRQRMIEMDWCRNQINKQVDRVKRMFKWAVSEELVPGGVYESLRAVSGLRRGRSKARESKPVLPVEETVLHATLDRLSSTVHDMVMFQRLTGARPGEICELRPGDVNRTGEVWEYIPQSHKAEHHDRPRVIFIGPKAQEIVLPYLLRGVESYCFSPVEAEAKRRAEQHANRKTPLSCGNKPGSNRQKKPKRKPREKYDVASYGRAIRRAAELAEVPSWSPHQLRHSFATEVRKTHGLEGVQVCLGHSKADVTQVYAERDFALAARVALEVG